MPTLLVAAEAASSSQVAEQVVFWILAVVAVGAGLAVVTMRNIIHAALMLVLNFAAIAGMYLLLETGFLGVVQIIVYAGAIMVLFLFVIMLLGVDRDDLLTDVHTWHKVAAAGLGVLVLAGTMWAFVGPFTSDASRCNRPAATAAPEGDTQVPGDPGEAPTDGEDAGPTAEELLARATADDVTCTGLEQALADEDNGSVSFVGQRLFERHTFPFELSALLLTVATIGAIVLGRRKDREDDLALLRPPPAGPDRAADPDAGPAAPGGELAGGEHEEGSA